ncbi:uncharacterized protein LOC134099256 [Sardina pilchardus]|uniref:uncharacterized protein LOC134099256 n=1 Tax=Sardina pilchardus TaxID=27697 RepID=UPI002E0D8F37
MVKGYQRKRRRGRPVQDAVATAAQHVASLKKRRMDTAKDFSTRREGPAAEDSPTCREGHVAERLELSHGREKDLASCIFTAASVYFSLSSEKVRRLAYQFAVKHQLPVPSSWRKDELASEDWLSAFLKQHPTLPITSDRPGGRRGSHGFNQNNAGLFFRNLDDVAKRHGFGPEAMCYMDETGVSVGHNPPRVGTRRNFLKEAAITSAEQGCLVTMACSISASGMAIPPYFVFPSRTFRPDPLASAPVGSGGGAHPNGWLREEQFLDFLRHFVRNSKCTLMKPCLLLTDNHESYLSVEALHFALLNGIVWMPFPHDCPHLLLPMERNIYGPIKTHTNAAIHGWLLASPQKAVAIHDITGIITRVLPLATTSYNIMAGFKACAVFPLNPDIFTDSSITDGLSPSEPHSYGEPASIHNGGIRDTQKHTCIVVVQDGQGSTSSTGSTLDQQERSHSPDLSLRSHISTPPGSSTAGNGQTPGLVNSPESPDEDGGFCQVCTEPFHQSNSEVVCLQCVLRRGWGQGDEVDLSLVISPVGEPLHDLEAAHSTAGAAHDVSDSSPTRSIQSHSHSLKVDHFSATSVTQLQNVLEPVHTTELATHDVNNDTLDHGPTDSSPTPSDHNLIASASDRTESVENGHHLIASACTKGELPHPHNTTMASHTVDHHPHNTTSMADHHIHKDLAPTPNEQDHTHKDLAPTPNEQDHTHKDLAPTPNEQDHTHKDLAPTPNEQDHTHKDLAPTPNEQDHIHKDLAPTPNEQDHIHKDLAPTPNEQDHTHKALVPAPKGKDHTHNCLASAPNCQDHTHIPYVQDLTHKDFVPTLNGQELTHKELVTTPNVQDHTHEYIIPIPNVQEHTHNNDVPARNEPDHTHIDPVPMLNGQNHTHETPDVSESPPHSPTPEPLTPPSGQTPHGLDSQESSDEEDGLCQVCREPFPHSNSEVVCLQCVLRRKWGQGDGTDLSLVIPLVTEPQDDLRPVHDDLQSAHNDLKTLSDSSPIGSAQNHINCAPEPTGVLEHLPSPTPGPSTAPGGLDSDSSDEDDGLCQVCREPFAHSNSEVLCLQCVLSRKWGHSGL